MVTDTKQEGTDTKAITITAHEAKQEEAKVLVKSLLYMTTVRMANGREPLDRGYKKIFAKHLFATASNLRLILDELDENVLVGVRIQFAPREK